MTILLGLSTNGKLMWYFTCIFDAFTIPFSLAEIQLTDCAFTRWITEARIFDSYVEPLLPTCVASEAKMTSLKNEILYQLPVRLTRPKNFKEAITLLNMFLMNTNRLLQRW